MNRSIFTYTDYRHYLNDTYRERKKKKTSFSHRYVEQRVGISAGYFSRILNGSKNISDRVIISFIRFLKLTKKEGTFFENLIKYNQAKDEESRSMYYARMISCTSPAAVPLAKEQYAYFNELHHTAVRALAGIITIREDTDFDAIGTLLSPPLPGSKVKESLQLLEKLNLIALADDGTYAVTGRILTTGNHPRDMTIRTYLQKSLTHAAATLSNVREKERMAAMMTVAVSPDTYEQITGILAAARQEINTLIENEHDATRVYHLAMTMVPLSKPVKNGGTRA